MFWPDLVLWTAGSSRSLQTKEQFPVCSFQIDCRVNTLFMDSQRVPKGPPQSSTDSIPGVLSPFELLMLHALPLLFPLIITSHSISKHMTRAGLSVTSNHYLWFPFGLSQSQPAYTLSRWNHWWVVILGKMGPQTNRCGGDLLSDSKTNKGVYGANTNLSGSLNQWLYEQ